MPQSGFTLGYDLRPDSVVFMSPTFPPLQCLHLYSYHLHRVHEDRVRADTRLTAHKISDGHTRPTQADRMRAEDCTASI